MKTARLLSVMGTVWVISVAAGYGQLSLNFADTPGATLQFNGSSSSFQFNASTFTGLGGIYVGTQWYVTSETGGSSAVGLFGIFSGGPFSYGPITTSGSDQTANVTGPTAGLSINDGSGNFLTGNVDWIQVETDNSIGGINGQLTVNVTGLSYSGSNPDLQTVVANGPASLNVTFQFAPTETLTQLTGGTGPYNTSYSGSLAVVPEPTTLVSLLTGFGTLACFRRLLNRRA